MSPTTTHPVVSVTGNVYLVRFDEDSWLKRTIEEQEQYWQNFVQLALKTSHAKHIVLQLEPDDLLPSTEHETVYTWRQQELVRSELKPWVMEQHVQVVVQSSLDMSMPIRLDIRRDLAARFPKGTLYEIWQPTSVPNAVGGTTIEKGRI